jgi:hypothetical protein
VNCHENFLKFLHSDAVTYTAIWGDCFYTAGRKAYFLKERSKEGVKSLTYAGEFLVWASSLVITLSGPCFCLYWIVYQDESFLNEQIFNVSSALGPAVVTLLGSLIIAEIFGGVFRGCINSTVICHAADVEMFNEEPHLASNEILKTK